MGEHWTTLGIAAGAAVLWLIGIRSLRKDGTRREQICYTVLLAWCVYIFLSSRYNWISLTIADLNKAVFFPLGQWIDLMVIGNPG